MGMRRAPGGGESRAMAVAVVLVDEVTAGTVEEEEEVVGKVEVCKEAGAEDGEEEVGKEVGGDVDEEVGEAGGEEEVDEAEGEKVRIVEDEVGEEEEEEEEVVGRRVVSMVVWLSFPPVPEADVRIVSFCNCRVTRAGSIIDHYPLFELPGHKERKRKLGRRATYL